MCAFNEIIHPKRSGRVLSLLRHELKLVDPELGSRCVYQRSPWFDGGITHRPQPLCDYHSSPGPPQPGSSQVAAHRGSAHLWRASGPCCVTSRARTPWTRSWVPLTMRRLRHSGSPDTLKVDWPLCGYHGLESCGEHWAGSGTFPAGRARRGHGTHTASHLGVLSVYPRQGRCLPPTNRSTGHRPDPPRRRVSSRSFSHKDMARCPRLAEQERRWRGRGHSGC